MRRRKRLPSIVTTVAGADTPQFRVAFLLGAGASVAADIPATRPFVERIEIQCRKLSLEQAFQSVRDLARRHLELSGKDPEKDLDLELVYEIAARCADPSADPFVAASAAGLPDVPTACKLKSAIEETVCDLMYASVVEHLEPLRMFTSSSTPLQVFSTNYDTCVELACERFGLQWEDGFGLRWDPDVFDRRGVEVHLRKLHGSVLWFRDQYGGYFRSPLRPRASGGHIEWFGGASTQLVLYPARKSGYDAPLVDNLVALKTVLTHRRRKIALVVVGYSFRDDHVRQLVLDAARVNPNLRVVLIDPHADEIYRERLASLIASGHRDRANSPLLDRVTTLPLPLERDGEALRHLARDVLPALADATEDEVQLRQLSVRRSIRWWNVAREYLRAEDLLGYLRALALTPWPPEDSQLAHVESHLLAVRLALRGSPTSDQLEQLRESGRSLMKKLEPRVRLIGSIEGVVQFDSQGNVNLSDGVTNSLDLTWPLKNLTDLITAAQWSDVARQRSFVDSIESLSKFSAFGRSALTWRHYAEFIASQLPESDARDLIGVDRVTHGRFEHLATLVFRARLRAALCEFQ